MAEEDKKEEKNEGGGKSKIIIIVVAILVVLILLVGAGIFFMMSGSHEEGAAAAEQTHGAAHETPKEKKKHSNDEMKVGQMYPLDPFIVNLMSDTGNIRYLKTSVNLELEPENAEMLKEVEAKKPLIRDMILSILTAKTIEEVSTPKGKENLKIEITDKLNEKMQDGSFQNVYFTEFIIQ